jgi:hypothetical protein
VLDPAHPISDFFHDAPERVLAALGHLEASRGAVTSTDTLFRKPGESQLRGYRNGIFWAHIFGDGGFGHIETAPVIHPAAFRALAEVLELGHLELETIEDIACAKKALRGDEVIRDLLKVEDGDISGPRALAALVRHKQPDHPLLPLFELTRIPVPPVAARPMRTHDLPEAIDPWIGPLNEAWLELVHRANRDRQLLELEAPPIIRIHEAGMVQQALNEVYKRQRTLELVRPMQNGTEEGALAIAFAGPERLVVQYGDKTRVVDLDGRDLHVAPPAGCELRGVARGRYAVFHGFRGNTHPYLSDAEGLWPEGMSEDGTMLRIVGELSVLDVESGAFLATLPDGVPSTFAENGEPEELFLGGRAIRVGGDRPRALAYTHDLRFLWVGDEMSEILERATGLPIVLPAYPDEVGQALDLETGEIVDDFEETSDGFGAAIAFLDGRWYCVWSHGVLADHLGTAPLALTPTPIGAAFDPSGTRLALLTESEVVILDHRARTVIARFAT